MLLRLRTVLLGAVAVGVFLRVWAVLHGVPGWDASHYVVMGHSFASGKEFLIPYGYGPESGGYEPVFSHHFAPLWPLVLAGTYVVAGFSLAATMAASLLVSLSTVAVAFFATRNLFGKEKALVVAAVVSLDYLLIEMTARAYSENLLALLYIATIWAILRSLRDHRYVVLAGVFAGAAYLTKASVGYLFLLAGTLGLLWRVYYIRWSVFRDRYYLVAITIFLSIVGAWAIRNVLVFGWPNWETSPYTNLTLAYAVSRPLQFVPVMGAKGVFFLLYYATLASFFAPQLIRAARQWKDEAVSAHLLAVGLPALFGIIFAASFALYESWQPLWWRDNMRYVNISFVPLLWLGLRQEHLPLNWQPFHLLSLWKQLSRPTFRRVLVFVLLLLAAGVAFLAIDHLTGLVLLVGAFVTKVPEIRTSTIVGLVLALGLASINAATTPYIPPEYGAGRFLAENANDGDVVSVFGGGGVNLYYMYPYLAHRQLHFVEWNGSGGDFLLSTQSVDPAGYELLSVFNWTFTPGLVDSILTPVATTLREIVGLPYGQGGAPSLGDLFLYRPTPSSS